MSNRLVSLLRKELTTSRFDRRAFLVLLLVVTAASAYLWRHDIAQYAWALKMYFRQHVVPLTWPRTEFAPEAWAATPRSGRYVFARSLLEQLPGATREEVGRLLGEQPEGDSCNWELRQAEETNLWYVLSLEFTTDRVEKASVALVWLYP